MIWARKQTDGRGRRGRVWLSDKGSLTFSMIWRFPDYSLLGQLPVAVALWVAKALINYTKDVKVKWPNDLYINERKLAGILGESVVKAGSIWVIMGIGININGQEPIEQNAVSLEQHTNKAYDLKSLLFGILSSIDQGLDDYLRGELDLNCELLTMGNFLGKQVLILAENQSFSGVAKRINEDGTLQVITANGPKTIHNTQASVRLLDG